MSTTDGARELFLEALDRPAHQRLAFVRAHPSDPATIAEVEALLLHHDQADEFLAVPIPATPFFARAVSALPSIEGFELVREIGWGGMGVVYLATELGTGRSVALKVLSFGISLSGSGLARFHTEAQTTARLSHPAIVPLLRVGEDRGLHYIASAYIEGSTLARELDVDLRLGLAPERSDPAAIARFVAIIADALTHAHAHAVLHRDVKPSNILLDLEGRPYLADFGLARDLEVAGQTRTGEVTGTVAYMSPEQALGRVHDIDHRTDIFSLGVVLFEMLHGRRPFDAPSSLEVTRAIVEQSPVDGRALGVELPRPLRIVCAKALEKDPRDRYPTMAEFASDLHAFAEGRPIRARGPSFVRRARDVVRRRRLAFATLGVGLVVAAAGIAAGVNMQVSMRTPVRVLTDGPSAEVFARRVNAETDALEPARRLGRTPLSARLDPGRYRFVLRDAEGNFAELSRRVPAREELRGAPAWELRARISAVDTTLAAMVSVPDSRFLAGSGDPSLPFGRAELAAPAFAIDQREVTVAEFRRFLEATGAPPPAGWKGLDLDRVAHLPAAGVSWESARAFAEWAGKRLPTYAEWQHAARGNDGRVVPWSTAEAPAESIRAWACVERIGPTVRPSWDLFLAAGCTPGSALRDRSPYGLVDVVGSVAEWTDTPWRSSRAAQAVLVDDQLRAVVGGSWNASGARSTLEVVFPVARTITPDLDVGFRCARSLDPLGPTR